MDIDGEKKSGNIYRVHDVWRWEPCQHSFTFSRVGHEEALSRYTLKKLLLLVCFLDKAKESRLIEHDPCLFCMDAEFKVEQGLSVSATCMNWILFSYWESIKGFLSTSSSWPVSQTRNLANYILIFFFFIHKTLFIAIFNVTSSISPKLSYEFVRILLFWTQYFTVFLSIYLSTSSYLNCSNHYHTLFFFPDE